MAVFEDYARYYNLLYRDKDYEGETSFILGLLNNLGCRPRTLLDLGCGTGRHAVEMAKRGVSAVGADMSEVMLDMGKSVLAASPVFPQPELVRGDVRSLRLDRVFDVVTSLFHVMSYQTTEEDALALLATARAHLVPGGLLLFDFWYGPCVLRERPEHRVKTLEDAGFLLTREATPTLFTERNTVNVHYEMVLTRKTDGRVSSFSEDHPMRYWFLPELRHLLRQAGFLPEAEGAWMSEAAPSESSWGAWMLARRADGGIHV